MTILEKIRILVVSGRVIYSYHTVVEKLSEINRLRNLNLTKSDVNNVVMTGQIVEIFENDVRGKRYAIQGLALDTFTVLEIVCRIENNLVIITVYEPYF